MTKNIDNIVSWAKRRGFVFPSSEIYGGIGGIYDWGPYGVELKNNFKKLWWKRFVEDRDDIVGIESSIIMNKKVWEASGHTGSGFADPLRECRKCHHRFRADEIDKEDQCPDCGGGLTEEKKFNILVKTHIGPVEDESTLTYLRGETAQGMFTNFKQVLEISRRKIPFGIAQVGKSFRNEITPKNFIFRTREFEIAEIEYFVKPGEDEKWFDEWLRTWEKFYLDLGIKKDNIVHQEHSKKDLSHYSKRTVDLNYKFPFGEKELAGVANRTDFDLSQHEKASGKDLKYFDQESGEKFIPYVIEPTLGVERSLLALICDAYEEVKGGRNEAGDNQEKEVVLKIDPRLAPVKVAVLPLTKKLSEKTKKVYQEVKTCYRAEYDEVGSIGRRYRRQDEIGTPYCVTIDFETEKNETVTIRDRDTMKQERIKINEINSYLFDKVI
jgi:glycyl-tRNA synthetase